MKKILLVIMVMVAFSTFINAEIIASDYANDAVYSSWDNGDNGGTGFGAWSLSSSNTGGFFIEGVKTGFGDINTNGVSFGIWSGNPAEYKAERSFSTPLVEGNTFSVMLAVKWRDGYKFLSLMEGNTERFRFNISGKYEVYYNSTWYNLENNPFVYAEDSKFKIEVTQDNNKIFVKISRGATTWGPTEIGTTGALTKFSIVSGNTGGGDGNNFYFNSMEIRTDSPVPVELSSFTASIQNKAVVLNWATATEINNYGFEVERSFDKTNWNTLAFKNGYGNSNSVKDYTYTDKDITKNGMYYYRLKQIDNNGDFEYSNIVEVSVNIPIKFEVAQNYPNPFNPVTNISFNLPEANNVTLYIFNAIGQQIKTINAGYKEAGKHTIEFDGSSLNSGVYFYKVEAGNNSMIRKMALIK